MKALAVFDWNGTLLDDTEAVMFADNCALARFGGHSINKETFQNTVSIPKKEFFILHGCSFALSNEGLRAIANFAAGHYQERLAKCGLRSGAIEVLKFLQQQNVHVIILSNDMVDNIWNQLRRLEIETYIDTVLANTEPLAFMEYALKHDRLAKYIRKTGPYQPQIIVGDSTEEIVIGKKLALTTLSLLNGIHSQRRLASESPDFLLSELLEVKPLLQQIFGQREYVYTWAP